VATLVAAISESVVPAKHNQDKHIYFVPPQIYQFSSGRKRLVSSGTDRPKDITAPNGHLFIEFIARVTENTGFHAEFSVGASS